MGMKQHFSFETYQEATLCHLQLHMSGKKEVPNKEPSSFIALNVKQNV